MKTTKEQAQLAQLRTWAESGTLREIRTAAKRTMWEMGNEIGVSQSRVLLWERGIGLTNPHSGIVYSYYSWLKRHAGKDQKVSAISA